METYNCLVTGCGGDIGQSICKILESYPAVGRIIGCDIHENHPGKFLCDQLHIAPHCTSDDYFPFLQRVLKEERIDFIISASEPELRFYLAKGIDRSLFGIPMLMANQKSLAVGFDKLRTADFLMENGLPYPETRVISNVIVPQYPSILKSRNGSGSKQVMLINDVADFNYCKQKHPDFIIQEYLGKENMEFTCGLYRNRAGVCRSVVFKRTLTGGFSNFGVVEQIESISDLLTTIAEKLELVGSINVQLRLTEKGPVVFEINPRFSSTVLFRHLLGFNDVIWSIEEAFNLPLSQYVPVSSGRKFYKGYQEYYE